MKKEEILSKQTITNYSGVEFVKPHNALMAMQEYADQETQRLKDELAEKDKEIEISHNENRRMERHFLETVTVINSLRELQTEDLKQLQSELTELKEKHKVHTLGVINRLGIIREWLEPNPVIDIESAKKAIERAEQYYNETHKTK